MVYLNPTKITPLIVEKAHIGLNIIHILFLHKQRYDIGTGLIMRNIPYIQPTPNPTSEDNNTNKNELQLLSSDDKYFIGI